MLIISGKLLASAEEQAEVHDRDGFLGPIFLEKMTAEGVFDWPQHFGLNSLGEYMENLIAIATRCASTAFLIHMHFCATTFAEQLSPGVTRRLASSRGLNRVPVLCSMNSEPGMHYRRTATRRSTVTLEPDGHGRGARVVAAKSFCSGLRQADFALSFVGDPVSKRSIAVVLDVEKDVGIGPALDLLGLRGTDTRTAAVDTVLPTGSTLGSIEHLPTQLWAFGHAAISYGIGAAALDGLTEARQVLRSDGRWGSTEDVGVGLARTHRLSSLAMLSSTAAAGIEADAERVLAAKILANSFANEATTLALQIVGGESLSTYSRWSRLFRDATTLRLLPPSDGRSSELIGRGETVGGKVIDTRVQ